jgi:hypothetical protein
MKLACAAMVRVAPEAGIDTRAEPKAEVKTTKNQLFVYLARRLL